MIAILWLRELIVASLSAMTMMVPGAVVLPAGLSVPAVPPAPVVDDPGAAPEVVFHDDFDGPLETNWAQTSSSTPAHTPQRTLGDRTVVEVLPEGNLISHQPVPYEVGTTYRASAVVRMPAETGVHPSFWLRTTDPSKVGEMDVIESWGGKPRCGRVHVGFYWRYFPHGGTVQCQGDNYPADLTQWHTYSVEFTYMGPGRDPALHHALPTRFFVDGKETWAAPNSPMAPEFLRLQNKRNCPEAEQPTCGTPPGEIGGPSMFVDSVTVERLGRQPVSTTPDVFAVKDDGTNAVELHILDSATSYSTFKSQTPLPLATPGWRYGVGDLNGDLVSDLYVIGPAEPGRTSVQVLDGATGYTTFLLQTTIAPEGIDIAAMGVTVGDVDNDGRDDIYAVDRTAAGTTTVHVLDAETGFTTVLTQNVSAAPALDPRSWEVLAGDFDGDGRDDLYAVNRSDAGRVSVHVLDAATGFTTFLSQSYAVVGALDPATWSLRVADHNNDGRDDLYAVNRDDAGVTSLHVMDAATAFSTFLFESGSALPASTDPAWVLP